MLKYRRVQGAVFSAALVLGVVALIAPAQATEGYFQHGHGLTSKALAGAGVAFAQDAMAQSLNPAGLVDVEDQVILGISGFVPLREHTGSGPQARSAVGDGTFDSSNKFFAIPNAAVSYRLDDASVIGFSLYGNGGMNTEWEAMPRNATGCPPSGATGIFCGGKAGVDLTQLFMQATYAREIFDGLSVGVAPIFAVQRFEAKGVQPFQGFSDDPSNLSNNGFDFSFGYGGRVGIQFAPIDNVQLGAAYQTRTYMTEFDKYAGLFAEQGDFDIPPAVQLGVSWQPIDAVTLLFDYRHIWYSDVNAIGNPGPRSGLDLATRRLGPDDGIGFGWNDIDVFKFAAQWEVDDNWTLRGGYSLGENPIGSSEVLFNILAPGVIEHHFTGGLSYKISDSSTLNVAAFYAPSASVSGPNPLATSQQVELEMHQFEFSVGWSWKF